MDELSKPGDVIAVATDTVYGLAARIKDAVAVDNLFKMKGRSENTPLVVCVSNPKQVTDMGVVLSGEAQKLIDRFWPGPLTLVLPAGSSSISEKIRSGRETVGVRMPKQRELQVLLARVGPCAITSANPSGSPPAQSAEQVRKYFGQDLPIIGKHPEASGQPSTVVTLEAQQPQILRQGGVSLEEIQKALL